MTERAARWVDELIPRVAARQWVLTVPWPRRLLLARQPKLPRGVLKVALREIQRWLRRRTGQSAGQGGSVTVIQRFGSALNLNLEPLARSLSTAPSFELRAGPSRGLRGHPSMVDQVLAAWNPGCRNTTGKPRLRWFP